MRKTLCAVPVLLSLLCFALPAWGETPAVSVLPSSLTGGLCLASSTPGSTGLPDAIPAPVFKTGTVCGCVMTDPCFGLHLGDFCNGGQGQCFGLRVGNDILYCQDGTYQCACVGSD